MSKILVVIIIVFVVLAIGTVIYIKTTTPDIEQPTGPLLKIECAVDDDCAIKYNVKYQGECSAGCFSTNLKTDQWCNENRMWEAFSDKVTCACQNNKCVKIESPGIISIEEIKISDILMLLPQELQKHTVRIKMVDDNFSLSLLSSQIENISLPLTNYLIEFSGEGWGHAEIEIAQMKSDEDAKLLFERLKNDDGYQVKKTENSLCAYKDTITTSVINYFANCIKNNLIFKASFPKDKQEYIPQLGDAQQYNIIEELEIQNIIDNYDPSIYNAPLIDAYIHLKKNYVIFSNQSENPISSIEYSYKPEYPDTITYLKGEVFFAKSENEAETIFTENVDYLKNTVFATLIGNIENTKSIEFAIPGAGNFVYYVLGYRNNLLFLSEIKIRSNTGSLPSMPYEPPELPTKDTLVYLKYLTKTLYKNLIQKYAIN